jgi:GNAT superfamily N-acetyltransferase
VGATECEAGTFTAGRCETLFATITLSRLVTHWHYLVQYEVPLPLRREHDVDAFESRSAEQNRWLSIYARAALAAGTANVFVVTPAGSQDVVAYYAWRMGEITHGRAPARWKQGAGRYPQPVAVLARLAVDQKHERHGLGAGLLADVLMRFLAVSEEIGVRGLLIHCENENARAFYQHLVPEFEPLSAPENERTTLVLLAKDLRKSTASHRQGM